MKSFIVKTTLFFALFLSYANLSAQTDLSTYGGRTGVGFVVGDGLGPVIRQYLNPQTVVETGLYIGSVPARLEDGETGVGINPEFGFTVDFSVNVYGQRFHKASNDRIKAHGIALRTGHLFGDFSTSFLAAGWTQEIFRETNPERCFIFELGLKAYLPHWNAFENSRDSEFDYKEAKASILPYIRLHWNWFVKR